MRIRRSTQGWRVNACQPCALRCFPADPSPPTPTPHTRKSTPTLGGQAPGCPQLPPMRDAPPPAHPPLVSLTRSSAMPRAMLLHFWPAVAASNPPSALPSSHSRRRSSSRPEGRGGQGAGAWPLQSQPAKPRHKRSTEAVQWVAAHQHACGGELNTPSTAFVRTRSALTLHHRPAFRHAEALPGDWGPAASWPQMPLQRLDQLAVAESAAPVVPRLEGRASPCCSGPSARRAGGVSAPSRLCHRCCCCCCWFGCCGRCRRHLGHRERRRSSGGSGARCGGVCCGARSGGLSAGRLLPGDVGNAVGRHACTNAGRRGADARLLASAGLRSPMLGLGC